MVNNWMKSRLIMNLQRFRVDKLLQGEGQLIIDN